MTSLDSMPSPEARSDAPEKLAADILLAAAELVWQRHAGKLTVESITPEHSATIEFTSTPLEVATHYQLEVNIVSGAEAAAELLSLNPGWAGLVVDIDKYKGWRIVETRPEGDEVIHQVAGWRTLLAKPRFGEIASRFPFDVGRAVSAQTYFRQVS